MTGRAIATTCTAVVAAFALSGCAFSTTAKRWNHRVGPDGVPVYYSATTKVALQLLVVVPFIGDVGIRGMVNDLTEHIEEDGGDNVRIVQGSTENYWYGFPPFTWILTPVVSTVSADYRPSAETIEADAEEIATGEESESHWYKPWSW